MRDLIAFCWVWCCCLLFCLNSLSFGNQTDRMALFAFKKAIIQDPLGALGSWNDSLHFCQWPGITCDTRHERVTELVLESKKLMGSLSPHIGNLTFLIILNLQENSFQGEIPQELGKLINLQHLGLSNNSFTGSIPVNLSSCSNVKLLCLASNNLIGNLPDDLGSLSKLYYLNLRRNSVTGKIPPSFGNLSSLGEINLNYNNLEGSFPDSMGKLRNLKDIRSGSNKLSGFIPPSLWNLSSLIEYYIVYNKFQGSVPVDIGLTLPNLQNFGIAGNRFSGLIPNSIVNISKLDYFDIADNNFSGPVPADLGALKYLKWVDLSGNHLGSGKENDLVFLDSLINCSQIRMLILNNNGFRGILPNSIANFSTNLVSLKLAQNQISGNIPEGVGNLLNLTELSMEKNMFTGTIPSSIGKLHKLQRLNLYGNKLSGQVPSSLGMLLELYELHLQENKLTGNIPLTFKIFNHLRRLDLSQNYLNGTMITSSFSSMVYLNLSHNSFTGILPVEASNFKNLEVLDVSENKLSGEIPSTLQNCLKLETLNMKGNIFQGKLTASLSKLKAIQFLDLSHNTLSGEIPKDLQKLSLLRRLDLSFNDFQGELPMEGAFRNVNVISVTGNSKLCGGIPALQLPACPAQNSVFSKVKIVVLASILSSTFVTILLVIILYCRRKSRENHPSAELSKVSFLRVSYEDLLKATNGFSESNLIGMGNFGCVYKGILGKDEAPVAIKVLNLQERGALKSFFAECETLGEVRHRNLLKILTSCSSIDFKGNDFKALVSRFMVNGSLESWLHPSASNRQNSKILSFHQRLNIAIDVASALDYLHHHCQMPIVHCDVKPSNVLLDQDLTAHVGDFGLARFLATAPSNQGEDEASSIAVKGSIGYIPPEYGINGKVSTYGDVYSFGILLLEIFTGKRPTDEMFEDGLSLRSFTRRSLPAQVMEIADAQMFKEECAEEAVIDIDDQESFWFKECLESIFSIGIACSAESPMVRMDIKDVVMELKLIRDKIYQGVGDSLREIDRLNKVVSYLSILIRFT